ncbi:hypothetical protein [Mycoplasmopsis alligatoris]|uniref:Uncharacterized protein n=1 Tax=Mycoplasmopsis alligatoris A21JP2 TaxID=747682 RepID=D4XWX7_9BACT|nr:hypothetical protein [Mycoplasmopsis alligatoris]EFF41110.1 conserved hypothetical protein [Mycoplasmopsis alligatoris A21JP2]
MDKKTRKRHIELLVNVYELDYETVEKFNDDELKQELEKHQDLAIDNSKNPNKFWIIKGLPKPKNFQTTTSTKGGWIIFGIFIFMLLIAGLTFMLIAFAKHGLI